jgi:hypothetical protein
MGGLSGFGGLVAKTETVNGWTGKATVGKQCLAHSTRMQKNTEYSYPCGHRYVRAKLTAASDLTSAITYFAALRMLAASRVLRRSLTPVMASIFLVNSLFR